MSLFQKIVVLNVSILFFNISNENLSRNSSRFVSLHDTRIDTLLRKLIHPRSPPPSHPRSHSQTSRIKGRECGELLIAKMITVPPEQLSILDEDGRSHIPHYILGPYTEGASLNLTCVAAGGKCMTRRCTFRCIRLP